MGKGGIIGKLRKALRDDEPNIEEDQEESFKIHIHPLEIEQYFGDFFGWMAESVIEGQISKDLFSGDKADAIEQKKKAFMETFAQEFENKIAQLQYGLNLCIDHLSSVCSKEEQDRILNEMLKACEMWKNEFAPPHGEEKLKSGVSMQECFGFSNETMGTFYQCGKLLFDEGRIEDARDVFEMILMMNVGFKDAWIARGMVEHKLKNFEQAVECYLIASNLDTRNPAILYWLTIALLAINDIEGAEWSFGKFQNVVKEIGKKAEWKDRRNALKRLIQREKKS